METKKRLGYVATLSHGAILDVLTKLQVCLSKKQSFVFSRRFSFKGKMPDYSSDCFFLQTTILTLIGPLFRDNPETTKPPKAKSRQGKLSPKGPPFHFSLFQGNLQKRTCPLDFVSALFDFFSKIFIVPKGSPLRFF